MKRAIRNQLRERLSGGPLHGVKVTWRVHGQGPDRSFEEHVELGGDGRLHMRVRDSLAQRLSGERHATLQEAELRETLDQLELALDAMVTREHARFLPDSLIGEVTVEIDGEAETYFFLADEGQAPDYSHPPVLAAAIDHFTRLSDMRAGTKP